jgi:hypothetical protein
MVGCSGRVSRMMIHPNPYRRSGLQPDADLHQASDKSFSVQVAGHEPIQLLGKTLAARLEFIRLTKVDKSLAGRIVG